MLSISTQQLTCELLRSQSYTTVFLYIFVNSLLMAILVGWNMLLNVWYIIRLLFLDCTYYISDFKNTRISCLKKRPCIKS